jgi:hypothetical protein
VKRVIFLVVILALTACTITREPTDLAINTDTIAGYWSGKVAGKLGTGQELHQKDVGILIIAGCTIGKVCGKLAEDNQCPGDLILMKVDGNQYTFISETGSGTKHICAKGVIRMINLELSSDGTIYFVYHNGATLTGILSTKSRNDP